MLNRVKEVLETRGYEVEVMATVKNGVELSGIRIRKPESQIAPCIYENDEWSELEPAEVADEIERVYVKAMKEAPVLDVSKLMDKDYILENAYIAVQKPSNEDILKRPYLDLEAYVRVKVSEDASFKINSTNPFYNMPELFDKALENTKSTLCWKSMFEIMREMMGDDILNFASDDGTMYVANNESRVNGAVAIMFPEIFKAICEKSGADELTILPSSIHEVIAIVGHQDSEAMGMMVCDVNGSNVSEQDQLGNHAYYYSLATNEITY